MGTASYRRGFRMIVGMLLIAGTIGACGGQTAPDAVRAPMSDGDAGSAGSDAGMCSGEDYSMTCGECAAGQECLMASDELGTCAFTTVTEQTTCTASPDYASLYGRGDACGCEGRTCPQGAVCVATSEAVPGGYVAWNSCIFICHSSADCSAGEVCTADRSGHAGCLVPECVRDADCVEDDCGHCVRERYYGFQGSTITSGSGMCVYDGPLPVGGCPRGAATITSGTPDYPNVHVCH